MEKEVFRTIGLMSGTSMDGLDVADVTFTQVDKDKWDYQLNHATIYSYPSNLLSRLKDAYHLPSEKIIKLSVDLGRFYAQCVNQFIAKHKVSKQDIDFIASHGQTIFHQPEEGYTLQIGNGPELAVFTNLPSVVDFRTKDVSLGGNGAPLIPMADFSLFKNYANSFLNIGGFANLSFIKNGKMESFDLCPANIIVNHLLKDTKHAYDKDGALGKTGNINLSLLQQLNSLEFYTAKGPKSLGWEWVESHFLPILATEHNIENQIRTIYEHIAYQVGKGVNQPYIDTVMITGGGTHNQFLIEVIKKQVNRKVFIPESTLIDFKEAIGFAFLGLLRWKNKTNVLSSVTGAKRDSSSGHIVWPT